MLSHRGHQGLPKPDMLPLALLLRSSTSYARSHRGDHPRSRCPSSLPEQGSPRRRRHPVLSVHDRGRMRTRPTGRVRSRAVHTRRVARARRDPRRRLQTVEELLRLRRGRERAETTVRASSWTRRLAGGGRASEGKLSTEMSRGGRAEFVEGLLGRVKVGKLGRREDPTRVPRGSGWTGGRCTEADRVTKVVRRLARPRGRGGLGRMRRRIRVG